MRQILSLTAALSLLVPVSASAATLLVDITGTLPGAYTTINAAIDAAANLDTVEVYAGIYAEDVDFDGKDITVVAMDGPVLTIIAGQATAVTFDSGEGPAAVLQDFTVHSAGTYGIYLAGGASPTIIGCVIENLTGYPIYLSTAGSPLFSSITVQNNTYYYPVYSWASSPTFTESTFSNNTA